MSGSAALKRKKEMRIIVSEVSKRLTALRSRGDLPRVAA